nr:hypothetical protein [Tanacetum cinerariifolium]
FSIIYQPPQETSVEILHDHENGINSVQTFLRKFYRFSFFKTPKVLLLAWDRVSEIKNVVVKKQYKLEDVQELFRKLLNDVQNIHEELAEYINNPSWNRPAFSNHDDDDDDDEDYTIAITPEEPDNSLSMGDEHLDTILATKSNKVIKSSVEDLVPIPSESEGIPNNTCDMPFRDNSPPLDVSKDQFEEFSNSNDDSTSIDDNYFSINNINYVEASPPDSKLVSLEEAPHSPEYVPRDHVPVFVPEFKHPEDLVPAEDEAPASLLPPGFLSPRIRPLSPRALGAEMNAIASSLYHSLHPSGTPPLLPIHLSTSSTSHRAGIPEADTPPQNRPLLATLRPWCEVGESSAAAARRPGPTMAHEVDCSYVETRLRDTERRMMAALELVNLRVSYQVDVCSRESSEFCTRHHDAQKDRAVVRAKIKVLRSERLAYEQEGIQTREALARSEAYCRALEARVAVLETHARRLEWQR